MLGGILRKFGTESNGISGTFCAFALAATCAAVRPSFPAGACARTEPPDINATAPRQTAIHFLIGTLQSVEVRFYHARPPGEHVSAVIVETWPPTTPSRRFL